jgi:hypothetical protein
MLARSPRLPSSNKTRSAKPSWIPFQIDFVETTLSISFRQKPSHRRCGMPTNTRGKKSRSNWYAVANDQNRYFKASCKVRPSFPPVIRPNVELASERVGWLKTT